MSGSSRDERPISEAEERSSRQEKLEGKASPGLAEGYSLRSADLPKGPRRASHHAPREARSVPAPDLSDPFPSTRGDFPFSEVLIPSDVAQVIKNTSRELEEVPKGSSEAAAIKEYLDLVRSLPWGEPVKSPPGQSLVDRHLKSEVDGFADLKSRILEYQAVTKFNPDVEGPALLLVGAGGTGKSHFARTAASAFRRSCEVIHMGSISSAEELIGAPRGSRGEGAGAIIRAIQNSCSRAPVLVIDGMDKVPQEQMQHLAEALIEIVDPKRRAHFVDRYVGMPIDLSQMIVIFTAHGAEGIPEHLQKHLEQFEAPSYSTDEKVRLANRFLVGEQLDKHGLYPFQLEFPSETLAVIAREYTMEGGVHGFKQRLAEVCRKRALKMVRGERIDDSAVSVEELHELLGPPEVNRVKPDQCAQYGVAYGLAWTSAGGEVLEVEATLEPGRGNINATGSLGGVMRESVETALSFVQIYSEELGIPEDKFAESDLRIHFPSGGTPKDGPSAGAAIALAIASAFTGREVNPIALTGEINLRGRILTVGGLREKFLGAKEAGIKVVLYPAVDDDKVKRIVSRTRELREGIIFVPVATMDQVFEIGLCPPKPAEEVSDGPSPEDTSA